MRLFEEKVPVNDFERAVPCAETTAASKIGSGVMSLLRQLQCRSSPDQDKFSS